MKDGIDALKNFVTTVAIIVGGIWTYYLFINDRLDQPRALTEINFQCHNISDTNRLLYVTANIKNGGNSILTSREANLRVRQILPLPQNIKENVDKGWDIVMEGEADAEWNVIAQRNMSWKKNGFLIEPSEVGEIQKEFVIPRSVEAVEIYFYLDNEKNKYGGWGLSKFFVFNDSNSPNKAIQLTACSGS